MATTVWLQVQGEDAAEVATALTERAIALCKSNDEQVQAQSLRMRDYALHMARRVPREKSPYDGF